MSLTTWGAGLGALYAVSNPNVLAQAQQAWADLAPGQKYALVGFGALGTVVLLAGVLSLGGGETEESIPLGPKEAESLVRDFMNSPVWRDLTKPTQRPPSEYFTWAVTPDLAVKGGFRVSATHLIHGPVVFSVSPAGSVRVG